jgi:hypothetical protein
MVKEVFLNGKAFFCPSIKRPILFYIFYLSTNEIRQAYPLTKGKNLISMHSKNANLLPQHNRLNHGTSRIDHAQNG